MILGESHEIRAIVHDFQVPHRIGGARGHELNFHVLLKQHHVHEPHIDPAAIGGDENSLLHMRAMLKEPDCDEFVDSDAGTSNYSITIQGVEDTFDIDLFIGSQVPRSRKSDDPHTSVYNNFLTSGTPLVPKHQGGSVDQRAAVVVTTSAWNALAQVESTVLPKVHSIA